MTPLIRALLLIPVTTVYLNQAVFCQMARSVAG